MFWNSCRSTSNYCKYFYYIFPVCTVVTVGFREPSYTFSEAGVTGTIEMMKTGTAAAPFDVFVSGG